MPAVSLIVHLEGGRERARRCLEALAGLADEPSFEAVIVDDASPDLGELLGGLSGDVKVLRRERREGFLACAIAGAEAASSEVLVLLRDAPSARRGRARPAGRGAGDPTCAAAAATLERRDRRAVGDGRCRHPTLSTHASRWRPRARAPTLGLACAPPLGAPAELELAAVCVELARRGRVVSVPAALAAPARAAVAARRAPGEARRADRRHPHPRRDRRRGSAPASPRSPPTPPPRIRSSSSTTARRRRASPPRSTPACAPSTPPTRW